MSVIRVEAGTDSWTSRHGDPDDPWDRDDTEGHVTGVEAFELRSSEKPPRIGTGSCGEKALEGVGRGDRVWAVVAQYSTGDTFGRDGGQAQLLDVFASEAEADGLLAACDDWNAEKSANDDWRWWDEPVKARKPRVQGPLVYQGTEYYTSWTGYFEALD